MHRSYTLRSARWLPALLLLLLLGACGTADPLRLVEGGTDLQRLPPVPLRIGLLPVEAGEQALAALAGGREALPFAYDLPGVRARLIEVLDGLNTCTEVVALEPGAETLEFDLLLRPRLRGAALGHVGATRDAVLSSLLWLCTWVGGFFLGDCEYQARLDLEWEVILPDSTRVVDVFGSDSDRTQLSFFDRNRVLSWALLQSIVIPPVFTTDQTAVTARTLSDYALAQSGAFAARYLKQGMGGLQQDLIGTLRLEQPKNGARLGQPEVRLQGRFSCGAMIRSLSVYLNDDGQPVAAVDEAGLPRESAQRFGRIFQVALPDAELRLRPGENIVRVYATFGGSGGVAELNTSRSIRLHYAPEER